MKERKIYYAHSKRIYWTKREQAELKWLKRNLSSEIIDPNEDIGEFDSMEPYLNAVSECDELILSEYQKHIGRGVFREVEQALQEQKMVRCLRKRLKRFFLVNVKDIQVIDEFDWAERYGKVITKNGKRK